MPVRVLQAVGELEEEALDVRGRELAALEREQGIVVVVVAVLSVAVVIAGEDVVVGYAVGSVGLDAAGAVVGAMVAGIVEKLMEAVAAGAGAVAVVVVVVVVVAAGAAVGAGAVVVVVAAAVVGPVVLEAASVLGVFAVAYAEPAVAVFAALIRTRLVVFVTVEYEQDVNPGLERQSFSQTGREGPNVVLELAVKLAGQNSVGSCCSLLDWKQGVGCGP
jgi:hypothetical protein